MQDDVADLESNVNHWSAFLHPLDVQQNFLIETKQKH